uniref:Uncharacterized protein n=1 Tax=Bionectria ochroleuca TaxID=29856 RepID=A0A8H7N6L5_BIOOC
MPRLVAPAFAIWADRVFCSTASPPFFPSLDDPDKQARWPWYCEKDRFKERMRHLKLPYALRQLAIVDYFVMAGSNLPNDLLLVIPSWRTTQFSGMGRRSAVC